MMELKNNAKERTFTQKAKDALKFHLIDSTALLTVQFPIFALFETRVAGIDNANSIHSRILSAAIFYGGVGRLYTKGMDASRKLFGIGPGTSEKLKHTHDAVYAMGYGLVTSPLFYYAAGVRDFKQIATATAVSMGLSLTMGGPWGYTIDAFRDLTGLKESERLPESISTRCSRTKKAIAALAIAVSLALTAGFYLTNHPINHDHPAAQHALENH